MRWKGSNGADDIVVLFVAIDGDDDDDDDDVVDASLNFLLDVLFVVVASDKFVGVMTGEFGSTSIELIDPARTSSVDLSYLGLLSNMGRETEILFLGRSLRTGAVGMSKLNNYKELIFTGYFFTMRMWNSE